MDPFKQIYDEIVADPQNKHHHDQGFKPLYVADAKALIVVVGQAPGIKTQLAGTAWHDASGDRLRSWLGVTEDEFYNPALFSQLPMDFYYPGKGKSGDLPPRKDFAQTWHPRLLALMPKVRLIVLAGLAAQRYYLGKNIKANLTENIKSYQEFLPDYFPIVHPSPLNFRWHMKNPWFEAEVVPELQAIVRQLIDGSTV